MKIVLITGGSRGLGASMAIHSANIGYDAVITYKTGKSEAKEIVEKIYKMGRKAACLHFDALRPDTIQTFIPSLTATLEANWGRKDFDALINNAGVGVYAKFAETSAEQFDMLANIHLKTPFFLTQKLLPFITDGGRIINISSGLARFSPPEGHSAYAIMKGGVEVLTRYLAQELGSRKISVNTLAPGAIETDFGGGMARDNKQVNAQIASQTSLGRVGLPDDVGKAAAAILSDGGWITGQRIEVSGGFYL